MSTQIALWDVTKETRTLDVHVTGVEDVALRYSNSITIRPDRLVLTYESDRPWAPFVLLNAVVHGYRVLKSGAVSDKSYHENDYWWPRGYDPGFPDDLQAIAAELLPIKIGSPATQSPGRFDLVTFAEGEAQ